MDILLVLQESGSAEVFVALVLLPWVTVALMQAFSLGTRHNLDDNFGARAGAALRWAEQNPDPAAPVKSAVLEYRMRTPARVRADDTAVVEVEAA
jgi:hypothetical protein